MDCAHAPSEPGSVVLDIGGEVGAAVVHAPASLAGVEVEIRRLSDPWEGRHVAIRARHLAAGVTHAALFDRLGRGSYQIRIRPADGRGRVSTFEVAGGRVTEVQLEG